MLRVFFLVLALLATISWCDGQSAEARIISRGNPGSHYNVHGVNYGSMRWERKQGNRRSLFGRTQRGVFHRR